MSIATATRVLLDRLGTGRLALHAVILELPARPSRTSNVTKDRRDIFLKGRHGLGSYPEAQEAVDLVLRRLHDGVAPHGVEIVGLLPMASLALADVVDAEQCWVEKAAGHGGHVHDEVWG